MMGDNGDMCTFLMHYDTISRKGSTLTNTWFIFCGLFVYAGQ